uniref:Uncharacterized protein n=1 Tax=Parascaris equorum TaxID=6256 RepID=A0A914RDB5_PAREQ
MNAEVLEEKLNEVRNEADLPNAIIVTNVPSEVSKSLLFQVFSDDEQKSNFSSLFTQIEANAHFDFLRSFHRVRIIFSTPENATTAKLITQHLSFNGTLLKAFFAQVFGGDDDKPKIVIHPASEADEEVTPSQSSMPRTPRPPTTPRPTHKNFA